MTDVITKVSIGGQVYPFAGGGSEGQEVVYLTQAEYDVLPASKLTDGKIYKIKTSGVAPTPGGGTVGLDSNIVLNKISEKTGTESSIYIDDGHINVYNDISILKYNIPYYSYNYALIDDEYLFYATVGEHNDDIYKLDLTNYTTQYVTNETNGTRGMKCTLDYLYFYHSGGTGNLYYKILINDFSTIVSVTENEYNSAVNYGNSVNGLFYAQDGNDYVATDINGTEVKRYVGVGTITGIANGKLWRTVGDVSYAIATI